MTESIEVQVLASDTGEPVANLRVEAMRIGQRTEESTFVNSVTNEDGNVRLELSAGDYQLIFTPPSSSRFAWASCQLRTMALTVDGPTPKPIIFELET